MNAVILSIGDELVLGQSVDTNSAFLSGRLAELGLMTLYHQTVADDRAAITAAVQQACAAAEVVIISGGLGPTQDDLTRQAVADAMSVQLVLDEAALKTIAAFFTRRGRTMSDSNRVQAMHPVGTTMLANSAGTAPGIKGQLNRATFYVVPGVPREMQVMFQEHILPDLTRGACIGAAILTAKVNTFGLGESAVGELLGDLMRRDRNPVVGTTVAGGVVSVRLRCAMADPDRASKALEATRAEVERHLGAYVFGRQETDLPQATVDLLRQRRITLATAESCTGGLIGKFITDVPGSSNVFLGGWTAYSNHMKVQQLGVPSDLIEVHGAVSGPVARAMAAGAISRSGAGLGVSITGIAGPEGGSPEKPVGTIWVGLAAGGEPVDTARAVRLNLAGLDRQLLRDRAAKTVLQLIRFHLLNVPFDRIQWVVKD